MENNPWRIQLGKTVASSEWFLDALYAVLVDVWKGRKAWKIW